MPTIEVYHTQERRTQKLYSPILAEGLEQWLGDGYYFWQDLDFAHWWGQTKKCKFPINKYTIFVSQICINEENFIDTVFNEQDYYNFVKNIEKFARLYERKHKHKPTLEEFNDFIVDHNIWGEIKIIRFQDIPENNDLVMVNGLYYKKRIQIVIKDLDLITNFAFLNDFCKK